MLALRYGASPELRFDNRCHVLLDGRQVAEFSLKCIEKPSEVVTATVDFPPGRHELMFVPVGIFSVYSLEVR